MLTSARGVGTHHSGEDCCSSGRREGNLREPGIQVKLLFGDGKEGGRGHQMGGAIELPLALETNSSARDWREQSNLGILWDDGFIKVIFIVDGRKAMLKQSLGSQAGKALCQEHLELLDGGPGRDVHIYLARAGAIAQGSK